MATVKLPAQAEVKADGPADAVQRKTYSPPLLTTYGHISKLTMAQAGSGNDIGTRSARMMRMACL